MESHPRSNGKYNLHTEMAEIIYKDDKIAIYRPTLDICNNIIMSSYLIIKLPKITIKPKYKHVARYRWRYNIVFNIIKKATCFYDGLEFADVNWMEMYHEYHKNTLNDVKRNALDKMISPCEYGKWFDGMDEFTIYLPQTWWTYSKQTDEPNSRGNGIHQYIFDMDISNLLYMQLHGISVPLLSVYLEGNPKIEIPEMMITYKIKDNSTISSES